jgi:hypothetical protein
MLFVFSFEPSNGVSTLPCGSFEGPVMFANVKENK